MYEYSITDARGTVILRFVQDFRIAQDASQVPPLRVRVGVPLSVAFAGGEARAGLVRLVECGVCDGSGASREVRAKA